MMAGVEKPSFPGLGSQVLVWISGRRQRPWLEMLSALPHPWSCAVGSGTDLGFSQVFITGARAGTFFKQDLQSRCRKPHGLQMHRQNLRAREPCWAEDTPPSPAGGS